MSISSTPDGGPPPLGPVLVVGAGLLGTSIGLALTRQGETVRLRDVDDRAVRTAAGLGAGRPETVADEAPRLVVVAVPPDHLAAEIARALDSTDAVVTDVGSVKSGPTAAVTSAATPEQRRRYVGSHPMAGSERSGPLAASASLFEGRPWAVTPTPEADRDAVALVTSLAVRCGATPVGLLPEEHDRAVARTSHLPHLVAVLMAGRLADAPAEHLALTGQGVRDVTRIAAGDPALWRQIIGANATAIGDLLDEIGADLDLLRAAVRSADDEQLTALLARGVAGTAVIPGKHGAPPRPTAPVFVAVPDHPGELARMFADIGEIGVNVEDLHIDHDPGREVGLVEVTVADDRATFLAESLGERGWTTHR